MSKCGNMENGKQSTYFIELFAREQVNGWDYWRNEV